MTSSYIVIKCPDCGQPLIASALQKAKVCVYCNKRLNLSKVTPLAKALSAREATRLVIAMKMPSKSVINGASNQ